MARSIPPGYRFEPLGTQHDRASFISGIESLDRYFHQQAGQEARRRVASCFVLAEADGTVAGFYTLSATSIALTDRSCPAIRSFLPL